MNKNVQRTQTHTPDVILISRLKNKLVNLEMSPKTFFETQVKDFYGYRDFLKQINTNERLGVSLRNDIKRFLKGRNE